MSWQMNSQSFIPRDVTPDLLDPRTSRGSWTLFTLGQTVALSGLIVEGALDSQWVEDETTRRAVDALRAIDPDYPFPNLSTPTESSRRPERAAGGAGKRLFLDGFQGNRDPAWTIESEERETYSFSTRPGTLTIETQSGTFAGSSTGYKNVFLIPSPATEGQDFEVTTRLLDFHPSAAYHQAGIIAIDDPDNYVMASIQFGGETRVQTRRLALGEETRGEVRSSISGIDQALSTFWLRMEKRGNAYRVLISLDGEVWEPRLHTFWGDGRPKRLGLFAMDASRNAPRIGASFDFFEVRALPSAVAE
jgi:regulation of enolase protein 1 (concanavalin A-like superfamily)